MELDVLQNDAGTEVGSYFIANYPPFSAWSPEQVPLIEEVLDSRAEDPVQTGLYLHIPFCRKRCRFCYFRVYTDKNARDIEDYLAALGNEAALYAKRGRFAGRNLDFIYFGGGTPSYLSADQLRRLVDSIGHHFDWAGAREVTFECEPGTLKKSKLEAILEIGTTRLSLGIEHFDDEVLAVNGRAHRSPEVTAAYGWAREVGFDQINVDLIAGMIGDTEDLWKSAVDRTLALEPDSLTVYQMELPHNTLISRDVKETGSAPPVADWATKRRWVDHAFRTFESAGYRQSSAYTMARPTSGFVYRDALWHGADLLGTGVASFSHLGGLHYQNEDSWGPYLDRVRAGELPVARALRVSDRALLIREFILQLKVGEVQLAYFQEKFGSDARQVFGEALDSLVKEGFAAVDERAVRLTRAGLLGIDALLPRFFESQYKNVRYT